MSVFTIFFCSTGSNSTYSTGGTHANFFHAGELISKLASNMATPQYRDWIIVDGPGSGNFQANDFWVPFRKYSKAIAGMTGAGWDQNVRHAMAVLKNDTTYIKEYTNHLFSQRISNRLKPNVVNLVGWSRGAVTCHLMANAMLQDPETREMEVNIFAVDPVPGLGNFIFKECTTLGTNVKKYIGIYARDERSICFSPTIPSLRGAGCVSQLISMPGRHATVVGNASLTGQGEKSRPIDLPQPGKIVRWLAEKVLTEWGTTSLTNKLNCTEEQILQLYEDIHAHENYFLNMRKKHYLPIKPHSTAKDRPVGLINLFTRIKFNSHMLLRAPGATSQARDTIFVNQHHQTLFNKNVNITRSQEELMIQYPHTYGRILSQLPVENLI